MNPVVLIIEDNEQNLYLMRFLLGKNSFTVKETRDGRKGVKTAKEVDSHFSLGSYSQIDFSKKITNGNLHDSPLDFRLQ